MRFTDIFIKRPVLAICVNLIILIVGIQSINKLTTRQYPQSDFAKITVRTMYVGANADLVRGFITTPLERVIASADGIDYIESSSTQGLSTITVNLKLNYPVNEALTQIQSKVNQVKSELPAGSEEPIIDMENTNDRFASLFISFYSDELEANEITDYLIRVIQPKLSSVPGVQKAEILGGRTFAMRVWLNPDKMASMNIRAVDVYSALRANNYLSALGSSKGNMVKVVLNANTDVQDVAGFENLVIKDTGGTLIRLKDIAKVELGAEDYDTDIRFRDKSAIFIGIWALPNANALDVVSDIRKLLPEIEKILPSGLSLKVCYDATDYIRNSIAEVKGTLYETIIIVMLVIFLFIGSFRSVLVPIVVIPLSLIGAFGLILILGFSINLLTLLAIVLAVGLVVDDAIVMLENIERHASEGKTPFEAAIIGARELIGPIVSMTITLAAVYAPIGLQGGLTGTLFKEFAFTLAGTVLISGVIALTLSPMMASKLISKKKTPLKELVEKAFEAVKNLYEKMLKASLNARAGVLVFAVFVMLLIFPLYKYSTSELAPSEDNGAVMTIIEASANSTKEQTVGYMKPIEEILTNVPETDLFFNVVQFNTGFSVITLKPWKERKRHADEIRMSIYAQVAQVPGVRTIVMTPPPLPGGSMFPVEFVITSTDEPRILLEYANELVKAGMESKKFMYIDTDLKYDLPESKLILDHEKIGTMGLNLSDIGQDVSIFLGGNYVNRFNMQGRSYKVIPQINRKDRLNPEQILDLHIKSNSDNLIKLGTVGTLKDTVEPRELKKFNQLNAVKINGVLPTGVTIDGGLRVLEDKAKEILPTSYQVDYAGESRQLRTEGDQLKVTIVLSFILIYLVLASQFESFRDPFIILMGSVPLALSGALLFSFLGFTTINIYSQVGLVTLIGLISKNGILIVEFANSLREKGLSKLDAITQACLIRLRPVLMTTAATIVGHFPLVIARGPGAGARNSIGIMLVTGMFIGTLFTLFVVPNIYMVISKKNWKKRDIKIDY
ncbi:MAG: efflux RND transporter permease subunit [Bdellovibrionota bacterium]